MTEADTFWERRIAPLFRLQFARYVIVGAANTGFGILVYWAMLWSGLAVPAASLVSLVVGILVGFGAQSRFVFDNRDPRKLLPYLILWGLLYVFNLGAIGLFMHFHFDAYVAGLLAAPATLLLSYFLQRSLVFRR